MNPSPVFCRQLVRAALAVLLLAIGTLAPAQVAPATAVDAATLARYDQNHNGRLDPDEQAALDRDRQNAAAAGAAAANGGKAPDEVVSLSPFEVVSEDRGYYGANTMSGTRVNSKLEDLASSITVVTKQQMDDFA